MRQVIPLGFRAEDNRQQYRCQCCGTILIESLQFGTGAVTSAIRITCGKCKTPHTWTVSHAGIEFSALPSPKGAEEAHRQYRIDRSPRIDKRVT